MFDGDPLMYAQLQGLGPLPVRKNDLDDVAGKSVFIKGVVAQVTAGATTDIDVRLNEPMALQGGSWLARGVLGPMDVIHLEVVDKDNVLGLGAVVLDRYAEDIPVLGSGVGDEFRQGFNEVYDDAATIPAGVYLRLKYVSTVPVGTIYVAAKYNLRRLV